MKKIMGRYKIIGQLVKKLWTSDFDKIAKGQDA